MIQKEKNPFGARNTMQTDQGPATIYRLDALEKHGPGNVDRLPFSIKILLEAVLRQQDGKQLTEEHVETLLGWGGEETRGNEIPFKPARVLMQDFTGVPAIVDLAALRSAMARLGGVPERINPLIPVDLVVDHSVQVDKFGSADAAAFNAQREFQRNEERYTFLRWGSESFDNLRVVPPDTGIVHQVNLEYLATGVQIRKQGGELVVLPDSLVGTDSHTTMINALGVLGWGVGGIEAEAVMLGQPLFMLSPEVVGVKLTGTLPRGATATDLVLTVTEMLREHGVVGKFVEFFGSGLSQLSLPDRATVANMSPEYGATMGFFPVDQETLRYLSGTGRDAALVAMVERYCKEQGLFHTADSPEPEFSETLVLDMETVEPCLAGPKRPQDRVPLHLAKSEFRSTLEDVYGVKPNGKVSVTLGGKQSSITHGAVVIAAITSCTNTSNPSVMVSAGLLARKATEKGLEVPAHVKTSLAPGSRVVTRYLAEAGLVEPLQALGFHLVGYGCTTCIGNSGPLPEAVAEAIHTHKLVAASVLSGNRNFEGRINPDVRASYLASPPLVVAYALAGTMDIDLDTEPLGHDAGGTPVYLKDLWPEPEEVQQAIRQGLNPGFFESEYADVFSGNQRWNEIPVGKEQLYNWSEDSTYIKEPPFFEAVGQKQSVSPIRNARILMLLGDSVTTDHISPAGAIPKDSPAGAYLLERGIKPAEFNSFGSRRGNHEVMLRGTFGNIRIRNQLAPGTEGGYTRHLPTNQVMSVYDAAQRYGDQGTPLLVVAGKEYGTGSSRDWAAKGTMLLGVRAVLAQSYERIHRSNLVGMGVLPLQFQPGASFQTLGLSGEEVFNLEGPGEDIRPSQEIVVKAQMEKGKEITFSVTARLDSWTDVNYYKNGGILQTVLLEILEERGTEAEPSPT